MLPQVMLLLSLGGVVAQVSGGDGADATVAVAVAVAVAVLLVVVVVAVALIVVVVVALAVVVVVAPPTAASSPSSSSSCNRSKRFAEWRQGVARSSERLTITSDTGVAFDNEKEQEWALSSSSTRCKVCPCGGWWWCAGGRGTREFNWSIRIRRRVTA